jgi:hypothetical protein
MNPQTIKIKALLGFFGEINLTILKRMLASTRRKNGQPNSR